MSQTKAQLIDNLVSPITGALGSASAPTFSFTADPNTGIYSPGADQLAISTNGTGRLSIDSSGNVGIGTTSPGTLLHLSSATGSASPTPTELRIATTTNAGDWSTTDPWGRISYYSADASAGGPKIQAAIDAISSGAAGTSASFDFKLASNIDATLNSVMRINYLGQVGIGTTSDLGSSKVFIAGDSIAGLSNIVTLRTGPGNSYGLQIKGNHTSDDWSINNYYGGALTFGTNNAERVRITAGGAVGIGTTSPSSALEVYATAPVLTLNSAVANASSIVLQQNGTTYARFRFDGNNVDIGNLYVGGATIFNAGNAERARIDSSGRLLVGTSSARAIGGVTPRYFQEGSSTYESLGLCTNDNSFAARGSYLLFARSRGTTAGSNTIVQSGDFLGGIAFAGADGSDLESLAGSISCEVDGTPGANDMPGRLVFSTTADGAASPTERLRIDSSGNVGVGVASPERPIHLPDGSVLLLGTTAATGTQIAHSASSNFTINNKEAGAQIFYTNDTERLRITSAGLVGIGTSSPATQLQVIASSSGDICQFGTSAASGQAVKIGVDTSAGTMYFKSNSSNYRYSFQNTAGTENLVILNSGNVGIGTASPSSTLHVTGTAKFTGSATVTGSATGQFFIESNSGGYAGSINLGGTGNGLGYTAGELYFGLNNQAVVFANKTSNGESMRITGSGNVGIGTTSPSAILDIGSGTLRIRNAPGDSNGLQIYQDTSDISRIYNFYPGPLVFGTSNAERARIDSSGRLLVGTSTSAGGDALQQTSGVGSSTRPKLQLFHWEAGDGAAQLIFSKSRGSSFGSYTVVNSGDELGGLFFQGSNGSAFGTGARIDAVVDSAWGSGDYPTRLVFSTTAGGASSPTEAFRINSFQKPIFGGPTIRCLATYNSTTASAANQFVDSAGDFYRSTSSIKYKTNVETIEDHYSDALLQCHPVWYQSTCEADNPDWGHWGFIAEEVAQIDPRLCFFKEEEDGSLEPEGVQYDRFVPHLLNLIKRQKEQIEAMEARLSALESA
jgi:hypothetical protein